MKTWDTVTKEEVIKKLDSGKEIVVNTEMINKLNWTDYIRHIRDMIETGMYLDRELVDEHIADVLVDIFMTTTRLVENRPAEPSEISEYMNTEYVRRTRYDLVNLTMSQTPESWPEMEAHIRKQVGLEDE